MVGWFSLKSIRLNCGEIAVSLIDLSGDVELRHDQESDLRWRGARRTSEGCGMCKKMFFYTD
jgi:hypothetical protein